jgi:propionyl-CoA carboxylase alpha chain
MTMFSSLLVANRGEIARRIFRTARGMGLRCIAVFVDADGTAPFVRDADEAIRLRGGYLDIDALIEAARRTNAEAIHPGYGFLAENAAFAAAVDKAGMVWVGPSPAVIDVMGDKLAAKRLAVDAGVPTLPSSEALSGDGLGPYPLLVKAAAGGGGKGMRVVASPAGLPESVAAARREAAGAFGDDRVFLERYVPASRHVEIQILGDTYGTIVHLGERECSIQRRHQKIIEESPSPAVDTGMRNAMGEAALRLARAIGYTSAGTVEFLVDDRTHEFFFLEVNTRLQVEHPVTEAVTGIDLVREQLRIAAGEQLGYGQESVTFTGHAVEARLYAEDAARDFLPATGVLSAFAPAPEPAVRWDTGVENGSVVGVQFDPMLAKVIAHAPTRADAAGRLARALERLHLAGVTTNRDFLAATLRTPEFLAGDTTTDFIDRVSPAAELVLDDDDVRHVAIAAALWLQGQNRAEATVLADAPSGWRTGRLPPQRVSLSVGERMLTVEYAARRDGSFGVGDATAVVHRWATDGIDVEIDGRRASHAVTRADDRLYVQVPRGTVQLGIAPRFVPPGGGAGQGGFVARMPGIVLEVRVAVGDRVVPGQVLIVLEAMKMEHRMTAQVAGVVTEVSVASGQQVENGAVLLVIEEDGDSGEERHG